MRQKRPRDIRRIKRRLRKKGNDPSIVPRKKKFVFNTSRNFSLDVSFTSGTPSGDATHGGISHRAIRINDINEPFGAGQQADGFNHVKNDFSRFYTIGGKVIASFDVINCGGCKAFMFLGATNNFWDVLGITPNFNTPITSQATRQTLLGALEEKYSKTLISSHWLQKGDGYNSVCRMMLKYSPKLLDPDRGKIMDDDNLEYSVTGGARTGTAVSPTNIDYVHFLLVPNSEDYNTAFQGDNRAMIWGKLFVQQIAVGVNDEKHVATSRDVNMGAELGSDHQVSATNPTVVD